MENIRDMLEKNKIRKKSNKLIAGNSSEQQTTTKSCLNISKITASQSSRSCLGHISPDLSLLARPSINIYAYLNCNTQNAQPAHTGVQKKTNNEIAAHLSPTFNSIFKNKYKSSANNLIHIYIKSHTHRWRLDCH